MAGTNFKVATTSDAGVAEGSDILLLPSALDRLAVSDGEFLYAKYPKSRDPSDGYETISTRQLATAVNSVARYLQERLGERDLGSKVLAYIGPNSPYTTVVFIAAIKAGWEIFLPSERNTVPTQLHLLSELDCRIILTPDRTFAPVKVVGDASSVIEIVELPSLSTVCIGSEKSFPFTKTIASCRRETCFIVHTSGSTGFPKPIKIPFEAVTRMARCLTLPEVAGHRTLYSMLRGKRCIDLLPLNHPAGINIGILNAIYNKFSIILPPPGMPPTAKVLSKMTNEVTADWAAMAPLTMEELSKDPESTQNVTDKLSMLLYSGGSLPKVFGDTISPKVRLLSAMGSSETGPMPTIYPDGFDWVNEWEYLKFHPHVGTFLDPMYDGTFELTQQRTAHSEPYQVAFMRPGSGQEFRTKDLFMPHPHKDGLWTHVSRSDDVIVLLNSEKVNPIQCESIVATHPKIAGALMFGTQRFETGLLLELVEKSDLPPMERSKILDEIWVKVEEANELLPNHGKLDKAHILFTHPEEPILRTLKNTIRRKATLDLYKTRINKLYKDIEEMWAPKQTLHKLLPLKELKEAIREAVRGELKNAQLKDDEDFFQKGMDSLQVLRLVRRIRKVTAISNLHPSLVYQSPTIESLAGAVHELSNNTIEKKERETKQKDERMQSLRAKLLAQEFVPFNDRMTISNHSPIKDRSTVVLTGSTGYVGRYLLRSLLENPNVAHVYCFNRSEESASSQSKRNAAIDPTLPTKFDPNRVTFLKVDLTESATLGLPTDMYRKICSTVSLISHCAWPVDFNRSLSFFESSLYGLTNLIKLYQKSPQGAKLMFVSSVSAAMNTEEESVPEEFADDTSSCADAGYAESKWVGEALCKYAAEELKVPCTVVRLGQVAGAVKSPGGWNPADWVPALIMSSAHLGVLPDRLPGDSSSAEERNILWMPVDTIADVLVDLLLTYDASDAFEVCQPLNPEAISWHSLLGSISSCITESQDSPCRGKVVEVVTSSEWLKRLRDSANENGDGGAGDEDLEKLVHVNPALKLREFFEEQYIAGQEDAEEVQGSKVWMSSRAQQRSQHLRQARAITGGDMQRWIGQWFAKL